MDRKRLKILYIASTDGHLRSFHVPYLRSLTEAGCAVTAAGAGDGRGLPEDTAFCSVPFTKRMLSPRNLRAAFFLAKLLRREDFDEVICHTSLAAFFTRLGVMLSGRRPRVINVVHGYLFDDATPPPRRWVLLWAERLVRRVTDEILVMNAQDLRIARDNRLCRGEITLIPGMGVPLERFAPPSSEERSLARKALGLEAGAAVLVCAAEFSKRKNQAVLLKALALLPEDTVLLLPGDGALLEESKELAEKLGVASRVRFPGRVEDVGPYLRAADMCVSASRSEGLPFHVMEAMACALPCVLSDVKGHEDLLLGGECGILYPFGDAAALAKAVEALGSDAALRHRMGAQGARRVGQYALERVLPQVLPRFLRGAER